MTNFNKVYSEHAPQPIEITNKTVLVASNIQPYIEVLGDKTIMGYMYDYVEYTKDEYIQLLGNENTKLTNELLDTQSALCDIYELIEGGQE